MQYSSSISVKALYRDCAGAIVYNVTIDGSNASSLSLQAMSVPQLGRWYTFDTSIAAYQPGLVSHGIEQANPAVQTFISSMKYVAADSQHVAFVFQISYPNGRVLRGTANVPLAPGRNIQCQ